VQHEHLLGLGSAAEYLLHPVQRHRHVAVTSQDQQSYGSFPAECQGEREHARDRARATTGRERDDGAHARLAAGRGQGGPAAQAVPGHRDQLAVQADPVETGNQARRCSMS